MEDQQKFNQLLNEINAYKQQGDLIQQQIELIRASIAEVDALTNTLDDLEGKKSVEAFVPVGAGSFIKGELKNPDEVIVSIGSGIAVKKDVEGARETIARQKKDLQDSLDKMLANMQQVSDIIGSLSAQAEQLAAVAQGNMSATGIN
jgi:prefoldin alpha subunit